MTTFDRRLNAMQRRDEISLDEAVDLLGEQSSTLAWAAAERLTRLPGAGAGATISLSVDDGDGGVTALDVAWNANGVATIRRVPVPRA